jgi:hypothetical protein
MNTKQLEYFNFSLTQEEKELLLEKIQSKIDRLEHEMRELIALDLQNEHRICNLMGTGDKFKTDLELVQHEKKIHETLLIKVKFLLKMDL